jgi:pyruvate formate lyase activating enzyme
MISRRDFLLATARIGPLAGLSAPLWQELAVASPLDKTSDLIRSAPKARYWISTASAGVDCLKCHNAGDNLKVNAHAGKPGIVKCLLCAQGCVLHAGERGKCRARINVNGEMRSLVYGRPVSVHIDPIEKKPFYHFLPGSAAFSLATSGCPLRCKFCQNWEISQSSPEDFPDSGFISPEAIASSAASRQAPVIAFTYNEPTVFTEYFTDIARIAKNQKTRCVLVSCGFMNPEPLSEMCEVLDAIKIDLKGFSEDFYRKVCSAELQPVLRSIKQIRKSRVHLEIVNLVVPTLNDSEKMLQSLAEWVMGELGPDVPIHFTRFHPDYQLLNLPPTPVATLDRAREIAMKQGIHYAFVGNVPDHPGNHTYCPYCGKIVIRRDSFFIQEMNLKGGNCKFCGKPIAGTWS